MGEKAKKGGKALWESSNTVASQKGVKEDRRRGSLNIATNPSMCGNSLKTIIGNKKQSRETNKGKTFG